jgi:hypothetical protein
VPGAAAKPSEPTPASNSSDPTDQSAGSILVADVASGLAQVGPHPTATPQSTPAPDTQTAGIQTASVSTDRTSIRLQILPPLGQILPAIGATITSTGGPAAATLAVGLAGLGGLGVWLRHLGRRRG